MSELKHRTVKIRMRDLKALGACDEGRRQHRKFLPAVISTDPEENLKLALRLARQWDKLHNRYIADVNWRMMEDAYGLHSLLWRAEAGTVFPKARQLLVDRESSWESGRPPVGRDPQFIAQALAAMADDILSAAGR